MASHPSVPAEGGGATSRPAIAFSVLVLAAVGLVPLGYSALQALDSNSNDASQWVPVGLPEAERYRWFLDHFPSDEVAVVSWEGCHLFEPKLDRFAERLRSLVGPTGTPLFSRVVTGTEVWGDLVGGSTNLRPEEARDRLAGVLIGPDGQTTCCLAWVAQPDTPNRHAAVEGIYETARQHCQLTREQLHLGGPTVDAVVIDIEAERSLYQLAGAASMVALFLAWLCLRELRAVAIVFAVALYSEVAAVALVFFGGTQMNSVLIMMPSLVYIMGISAGVHLVNYYRDAGRQGPPGQALRRALRRAWTPSFLSSLTTAIGLGSLAVSRVIPVRDFGGYSAVGVLLMLGLLFLLGGSLFQVWPAGPQRAGSNPWRPRSGWWLVRPVLRLAVRHQCLVLVVALSLVPAMAWGLVDLRTSVKLQSLFAPQSRILQDYRWLEEHLGPLVPFEVILHVPKQSQLSLAERIELVENVRQVVDQLEPVEGTLAVSSFLPPEPESSSVRGAFRHRLWQQQIQRRWEELVDLEFLGTSVDSQGRDEELWRVSGRIAALTPIDYGQYLGVLDQVVQPVLDRYAEHEVGVEYTGAVPTIYVAQRELLNDLIVSFLAAFGLILVVLILALRSISTGVLAMLPNLLPTLVVFGLMGWLGWPIDIGTMMTASIGLGVAVDDTLHYLMAFRTAVRAGKSREAAVFQAARRCSLAMMQTTLICGLGLLPFTLSEFLPTARFAWLVLALLVVALVGDLLLLPALLVSPLGKRISSGLKLSQNRREVSSTA